MKFKEIQKILPIVEGAFRKFYNAMLKDEKLSIFFENREQIDRLIVKQEEHFRASLNMDIEILKSSYIRLGEYHHELRIPYVDFIKGTEILEEHFLIQINEKNISTSNLVNEIFHYFKIMKSFTAKGYLNKMIKEDREDIELFFHKALDGSTDYMPRDVIFKKIDWLKTLLSHIEKNESFDVEESFKFFEEWLDESDFLDLEKRKLFLDIKQRILINTKNLLYFLDKEEYLEILPLYASLLGVYKLILILSNILTVEFANNMIDNLRLDSMTKLLRKEVYHEFLDTEVAFNRRNIEHNFSVAFIDIDDFKYINDNYGHYSGDKVIEKLGEIIRNTIRSSDIGFRIGGDEFALILRDATKEQSKMVCNKILSEINSIDFIFNEETIFKVGLSIGVAEQNENREKDLNIEVDKKLYESKRKGKNQVSI